VVKMKKLKTINLSVRNGYKKWSKTYDMENNTLFALEPRTVLKFLEPVKNKKILDVGCGTGRHALKLASRGAKVTGIDFSKTMLKRAQEKARKLNINFKYRNITNLPFSSNSFDKVTCNLVLSHIRNLNKVVKEISRVVKKNGIVVISDLNPFLCGSEGGAFFYRKKIRYRIKTYIYSFEDFFRAFKLSNLEIEEFREPKVTKKHRKFLHAKAFRSLEGKPVCFIVKLRKK